MDSPQPTVEEIFLQAARKDPADRQAFLEATCPDRNVRMRVEALLKAHDTAGDFLESPAFQPITQVIAGDLRAPEGDPTAISEGLEFLERCDTPDRLGLLAHYEILDNIGRGGMGIVLRGVDMRLKRAVAIKVLAPQLAANALARRRFVREAQAAAAVSHQHVVAIHAVDEFKGLPYLVMEYVSGSSLQQKIDSAGALPLAQILRIGLQIASGLAAAHAQGLVHRDIKPANILLENGIERVKITDFGLARGIDDVHITQAGTVYGTPLYMSPEQAQGERVDQRSDLFSLGSVLYTMSTGRPPFRGDSGLAVLKRVCEDTPRPIREVNPDIPEAFVEVVDKLLAKNPDDRFQSASEVAELLSRLLAHLQNDTLPLFQGEGQTQPLAIHKPHPGGSSQIEGQARRPARLRWPLFVGAAAVLLGAVVLAALEGARLINLTGLVKPLVASANQEPTAVSRTNPAAPRGAPKHAAGAVDRPVKVFILAGDSNMAGRAMGRLLKSNEARTREYFQHLVNDGGWAVREDVWVKNFGRKGDLTVGFGQTAGSFGPELEFGHVVGDHFDEQVLLIKTCWGGPRLCGEFRSPSSGLAPEKVLDQFRQELQKEKASPTRADVERCSGAMYQEMLAEIRQTLANLREHFPTYQGQGFELAGFLWFQGWTDMVNLEDSSDYTELMANFIRDIRSDLQTPDLPFIIGQMGVGGGSTPGTKEAKFRALQAAVAQLPEFKGNVKLVETDPFWDHEAHAVYKKGWQNHIEEWDRFGSDYPYHYLGSAKTMCQIGKAFGAAILELPRPGTRK